MLENYFEIICLDDSTIIQDSQYNEECKKARIVAFVKIIIIIISTEWENATSWEIDLLAIIIYFPKTVISEKSLLNY